MTDRLTDDQMREVVGIFIDPTRTEVRHLPEITTVSEVLLDECLARGEDIATLEGIVRRLLDGWHDNGGGRWETRRLFSDVPTIEPMTPAEQAVLARLAQREDASDG